jgi:phenylalanyl-tRNA synthetase beta chain
MKVSLRWLEDFISLPTTEADELAGIFTMLGHEVEGIERHEADWSDIVVGRVEEITAHPDADRIRLCQVDTGSGITEIVCGAWNFEVGAVVPVAVPGAVLPGDFRIERREIRGVVSNGMICSERELGLGDDHEGILVLDVDADLGTPFSDLVELPDVVFDLAITPNRPDAMSMLGIARDLAAHFRGCRRFTVREIKSGSPWPLAPLGSSSPSQDRNTIDVQCRRRDQLCHVRAGPPAPRLRRRHDRRATVSW